MVYSIVRDIGSNYKVKTPDCVGEIFPLKYDNKNTYSFILTPETGKKLGNSIAWRLSRYFPNLTIVWQDRKFWVLGKANTEIPDRQRWIESLQKVREQLKEDFGDASYVFKTLVPESLFNASVWAELARRILQDYNFNLPIVFNENNVKVQRELNFWAEQVALKNMAEESSKIILPAIALTLNTQFIAATNLADFYASNLDRGTDFLIGLSVKTIETKSTATIVGLAGTVGERRQELIDRSSSEFNKQRLRNAPDNQQIVRIKFGKENKTFDYPLASLTPLVTAENIEKFDLKYGELLAHTKIDYQARSELLRSAKQQANIALSVYNLSLDKALSSQNHPYLFDKPIVKLSDTTLLFGGGITSNKNKTLSGLNQGGVYRRHPDFLDRNKPIRLGILNISELDKRSIDDFRQQLQAQLDRYGFKSIIPDENQRQLSLENSNGAARRIKLEETIDELVSVPCDVVISYLPADDRQTDNEEENDLYTCVYSRLLRRQIASQIIYEDTLKNPNQYRYILNQVVMGILAKLGNLPFILHEPLPIVDNILGLDIARFQKKRLAGSRNACASIRIYGNRGDFINYYLEDALIEGETIEPKVLEQILPLKQLKNQTTLIYRDGLFRGKEIEHLLSIATAIDAKFILVECYKSGVPRLYNFQDGRLNSPDRGLSLRLSAKEAIVVSTEVSSSIGVPNPLRLKIKAGSELISIEEIINITLKLTLLHHGSLKDPRLPMPLYGADRLAYLRLQGIYPSILEGDRQFWL